MGFASTGAVSKILNDPAKRERMQQIAAGAPRTPEEQADYDAMQEEMARIQAEQERLIATGKAEDAARAKDRSWWDKATGAVRSVGETFADAATGGGYSSVVAPALGYESQSYAAPIIEGTPLGDINRKAAEVGASSVGVNFDAKSPEELRAAQAGGGTGGGGPGGAGSTGNIDADARRLYDAAMGGVNRQYTPGTIRDPGPVTASGPAAVTGYNPAQIAGTRDVTAPDLGAATLMTGPRALEAAMATAEAPNAATIDRSGSDQIRGIQQQSLADLQQEAAGTGVGADLAKARLNSALARINQDTFAAAGMARGAGRTALQREAILQGGRNSLEAALKGEETALADRLAARNQLATAAQGVRGQDIDLGAEQARLTQQADIVRAQLQTAVSQGNAQEINRLNSQLRDLEQQAKTTNAAAVNRRGEVQGQLTQDAAVSNADRALRGDTVNVGAQNDAQRLYADAMNTSGLDYGRRADTAAIGNADRTVRVDEARDTAGRGAFDSTTRAREGAIAGANQAVGNRVDLINPTVNADKERANAAARDREFWLEAGTGVINNVSQGRAPLAPQGQQTTQQQPQQQRKRTDPDALATPSFAAYGGITTRPTIAGEAGPELVIPITGARESLTQALAVENQPADQPLNMDSELAEQLIAKVFQSRKARRAA